MTELSWQFPFSGHRLGYMEIGKHLSEFLHLILPALVRMEQSSFGYLTIGERLLHHPSRLREIRMSRYVVSDDLPVVEIHHGREIDLSNASEVELCYIGYEHLVGNLYVEMTLQKVLGHIPDRSQVGTVLSYLLRPLSLQTQLPHDLLNDLVVDTGAFRAQRGGYASHSVSSLGLGEFGLYEPFSGPLRGSFPFCDSLRWNI